MINIAVGFFVYLLELFIAFAAILLFNNPDYELIISQENKMNYLEQMDNITTKLTQMKVEDFETVEESLDFVIDQLRTANRLFWEMLLGGS